MASKINWGYKKNGTSTEDELRKAVRRFNAKVSRETKKSPELADIYPSKVSYAYLRKMITTRKEFNREMKYLQDIFKSNAFKIVKGKNPITNYELDIARRRLRSVNAKNAKRLQEANLNTEAGTMGLESAAEFRQRKLNYDKRSKNEWKRFIKSITNLGFIKSEQEAAEEYKRIYLKQIEENLGDSGKELYDLIKDLPADFIYKNYTDDASLAIGFTSDPLPTDIIATRALREWVRVVNESR